MRSLTLLRQGVVGVVLATGLLQGCGGTTAEDPTRPCTRVGQACKLPKGPLGICEKGLEAGYMCTPQH